MTDDAKAYVKRLRSDEAKEAAVLAAKINAKISTKIVTNFAPRDDMMMVKIMGDDTEIIKMLSRKDIERLRAKGYILKRDDGTIINTLDDVLTDG